MRLWPLLLTLPLLAGCAPEVAPLAESATLSADPSPWPTATSLTPTLEVSATPLPDQDYLDLQPVVLTDVELFYDERWMRVRQSVEFSNTGSVPVIEAVFNVIPNATPESFYLDLVQAAIDEAALQDADAEFRTLTMLYITLPRPLEAGQRAHIDLGFRVLVPPLSPSSWPPEGNLGWTFDLIQAGEFYPALVPFRAGEGWAIWPYYPVGDLAFYPLVDHTLRVTTQPGITVLGGGFESHEGDTWTFHVEQARGMAFFASDRYEVLEREVDGLLIRSAYLFADAAAGREALDAAENALRLYSELYGPYPYDDLLVVENGFFGAMEYSGVASVTNYAYQTHQNKPDSLLHLLVAHEIAHQWWYGAVGSDQINEAWLDESLGFYSELLYIERYAPEAVDWWWQARVTQFNPQGDVNAMPFDYVDSASFILWMYGRAAFFIRDLRALMGDEAFFAFLQDYYQDQQWEIATRADFFAAAERHASADLEPLIGMYFDTPPAGASAAP